jgi:hypothetical protein
MGDGAFAAVVDDVTKQQQWKTTMNGRRMGKRSKMKKTGRRAR